MSIQTIAITTGIIMSIFSMIISILSYRMNIANRRNSLREKVFDKEINFYMELWELVAFFNNLLDELILLDSGFQSIIDDLEEVDAEINILLESNGLIICDRLHKPIFEYLTNHTKILSELYKNPNFFTKEESQKLVSETVDVEDEIRDYLNIERLSIENKKLIIDRER